MRLAGVAVRPRLESHERIAVPRGPTAIRKDGENMTQTARLHAIRHSVLDVLDCRPLTDAEQKTLDHVCGELDRRAVRVIRWERAQRFNDPMVQAAAEAERDYMEALAEDAETWRFFIDPEDWPSEDDSPPAEET